MKIYTYSNTDLMREFTQRDNILNNLRFIKNIDRNFKNVNVRNNFLKRKYFEFVLKDYIYLGV